MTFKRNLVFVRATPKCSLKYRRKKKQLQWPLKRIRRYVGSFDKNQKHIYSESHEEPFVKYFGALNHMSHTHERFRLAQMHLRLGWLPYFGEYSLLSH